MRVSEDSTPKLEPKKPYFLKIEVPTLLEIEGQWTASDAAKALVMALNSADAALHQIRLALSAASKDLRVHLRYQAWSPTLCEIVDLDNEDVN